MRLGVSVPIQPLFVVNDDSVIAVGHLDGSERIGLAKKAQENYTAWFSSVPLQNPDLMRYLLRAGGAHIYNEHNDIIRCGGGILAIHTATGGARTIRLQGGVTVEVDLPARHTMLVDSLTGHTLLG